MRAIQEPVFSVANTDFEGGGDDHGYGDCMFLVIYAQPSQSQKNARGRISIAHTGRFRTAMIPLIDFSGEPQTQGNVGVREDCLRELLDSRCTKRCALQWRCQNCLRARACNSPSPSNLVFVTASCFGSENGKAFQIFRQ